jgi:tyrosyl-tRNA synthetase
MSTPKSEFLKVILDRGYLHQCTDWDALDALAAKQPVTAYVGFDATADSLHVGHMVQIMLLRRLQQTGHRPIALMGGGTTKVGDPSGKDESRKLLTVEDINKNLDSIKKSFEGYLTFGGGKTDAIMVNNADWLDKLNYIEFLRDYGRHFSVNRMLSFDSVKLRLEREQPLSFLEFNYMILQAYDFLELARRHDCRLQMGGSDQWGNIVNGTELGRRVANKELFGLTAPLITTASGAKMGKTAAGAVWLNPSRLSPYDYWQYWRNAEDADVGRFLKLFTDLPLGEIERLEALQGSEINDAKIVLANEATTLCHGAAAARTAADTARRTFVEGGLGQDLPVLEIFGSELLGKGIPAEKLFQRSGLVDSLSEARRLMRGGGAKVNDQPIPEGYSVSTSDTVLVMNSPVIKLSFGKKKHAIVKVK